MAEWYSIMCVYVYIYVFRISFIHSSVDGQKGYFQVLPIVNTGLAKKFLQFLSKNKMFFIFTKNFIEQCIHHFVSLPSAIFQAAS